MKDCPLCKSRENKFERFLEGYNLVKCCNCDFIFADITDAYIEEVNSQYDEKVSDFYDDKQTILDHLWFKGIAKSFTKRLGSGKVLDIGCGNGILLSYFKKLNWDCFGIDISPWSIEPARKYNFTLFQGRIEDLHLEGGRYDLLVSTSTLEHIAQPLAHVKEIIRLMKPGGMGFFSGIPNYASLSIRLNISNFYLNNPPGHVNYFTSNTIKKLFYSTNTNLKKIIIKTYGIPEFHRLYNQKKTYFQHYQNIEEKKPEKQNLIQINSNECDFRLTKDMSQNYLEFIIKLYYNLGRPFYLGDKLEVTVIK